MSSEMWQQDQSSSKVDIIVQILGRQLYAWGRGEPGSGGWDIMHEGFLTSQEEHLNGGDKKE